MNSSYQSYIFIYILEYIFTLLISLWGEHLLGKCKEVGLFEDFTSQVITRPKYEDASDRW